MEQCCNKTLTICRPFVGCPDTIEVQVPTGYEGTELMVRFTKNGEATCEHNGNIQNGYLSVDVGNLPVGFFNPYHSHYCLEFITQSGISNIPFVVAGVEYEKVCFESVQGSVLNSAWTIILA